MFILDHGSVYFSILDPGAKKTPDSGSGSSTLLNPTKTLNSKFLSWQISLNLSTLTFWLTLTVLLGIFGFAATVS
jgi:hypothetical protein